MKCFIYNDGEARLTDHVIMQVLFPIENGNVDLSYCLYAENIDYTFLEWMGVYEHCTPEAFHKMGGRNSMKMR